MIQDFFHDRMGEESNEEGQITRSSGRPLPFLASEEDEKSRSRSPGGGGGG